MEGTNRLQSRHESGAAIDLTSILNGYEGPGEFYMMQMLWAFLGAVIAFASLIHMGDILIYRHRYVSNHLFTHSQS